MADNVANYRPPASRTCINWDGFSCRASDRFAEVDITCYNEGNCDGFGTCRGCSKYATGGLRIDTVDGEGDVTQTPMNLRMYNVRAQIKPCCHWDGEPVSFRKDSNGKTNVFSSPFNVIQDIPPDFYDPEAEQALAAFTFFSSALA